MDQNKAKAMNQKTKTMAQNSKAKTKTQETKKATDDAGDFADTATSWCAEHNIATHMMPEHTVRLIESVGLLDRAIGEAGGCHKVPEAVLLYRQLLHEAAKATAMHGIKRAILGLYSATGR